MSAAAEGLRGEPVDVRADRRSGRARDPRRRRPAGAGVREPAGERRPLRRRTAGFVDARAPADAATGCGSASSTAARGSRPPSRSASSSRSTAGAAPGLRPCTGSGLGLAIVKGFVEANGGAIIGPVAARAGHELRRLAAGGRARGQESGSASPEPHRERGAVGSGGREFSSATTSLRSSARCGSSCATPATRRCPPAPARRRWTWPPSRARAPRSSTWCCPTSTGSSCAGGCGSGREMPMIVLSAVGEEDAKVRALAAGADDYVTKPFGPRELIARLQASLRRVGPERAEPVITAGEPDASTSRPGRDARRRGGPPHPDRVRSAAAAGPQPRPADDPPRAADRRCGAPATPTTRRCCAPTSPTCAARSSPRGSRWHRRTSLHPDRPGVGYRFAG